MTSTCSLRAVAGRHNAESAGSTRSAFVSRLVTDPRAGDSGVPLFWSKPEFTRAQVNAAGRVLATAPSDAEELDEALAIINNWRSSHSFPLNTFATTLRDKARRIYPHALVAQRLKRVSSIKAKLVKRRDMRLTQMQDIGGCRAIVENVAQVKRLQDAYLSSELRHRLHHEKNYIETPRDSGYRGVHLIYSYRSDRSETYNDLKIEMQLRSLHQHAWATAVETAGIFLMQPLKSSEGPEEWLRFFALTSSAFALVEGAPPVPGTPTSKRELFRTIARMRRRLEVEVKLSAYREALQLPESNPDAADSDYYLLTLDTMAQSLNVTGYEKEELEIAMADYLRAEKELQATGAGQAVLVSADSLQTLKRAYPNYYLDTARFLQYLRDIV
jgi:hypothetical protein